MPERNPNPGSHLRKVVEAGVIRTVEFCDGAPHHFKANDNTDVFDLTAHPEDGLWKTYVGPSELRQMAFISNERGLFPRCVVWIACASESCVLWPQEWPQILDLSTPSIRQTIYVSHPRACSFRVWGDGGKLPHTVPMNRFPEQTLGPR
jgi:hypothetical protein